MGKTAGDMASRLPLRGASMLFHFSIVFLAYAMTTFCRRLLFIFAAHLGKEILHIKDGFGTLVSTQATCFTISKILFSILSDRTSPVKIVGLGLAGIGAATACLAFSRSFSDVMMTVILNGFLQGAGWTASVKMITQWSPEESFGMWYSIFGVSTTFSGVLLPYAAECYWRTIFLWTGSVLLIFTVVFFITLRKDNVTPMIENVETNSQPSMFKILSSVAVWHVGVVYAFPMQIRTVCETWFPLFLSESGSGASSFQFSLEVGGLFGVLISGAVVDHFTRKWGVDLATRRCAYSITVLMLMIVSYACVMIQTQPIICGFLLGFSYQASINVWGLTIARLAPFSLQGAASAVVSLVSQGGSVLAGAPLSWIMGEGMITSIGSLFVGEATAVLAIYIFNLDMQMRTTSMDKEKIN